MSDPCPYQRCRGEADGETTKPWHREAQNEYYVTIRGKQHRLGPDKKAAFKLFHELMAKPEKAITTGTLANSSVTTHTSPSILLGRRHTDG